MSRGSLDLAIAFYGGLATLLLSGALYLCYHSGYKSAETYWLDCINHFDDCRDRGKIRWVDDGMGDKSIDKGWRAK